MPIKLNIGLSKKIGLPDYGSLGASCHVEVELASDLLTHDLDGFDWLTMGCIGQTTNRFRAQSPNFRATWDLATNQQTAAGSDCR